MKSKIMYIYTITPLHVGSGSDVGPIDSPVQRNRHTGFPIIPGSALKGVLRDGQNPETCMEVFGSGSDNANNANSGSIAFCEAKLLVFPLRNISNSFVWITCPQILNTYASIVGATPLDFPELKKGDSIVYASSKACVGNECIIEEYTFTAKKDESLLGKAVELLKNVCTENETYKTLNDRLVIVPDAIMSYFAKYACSVDQHVCINDETGIAKDGALFNIETVPTDTLFYSELYELRSGMFQKLSFSNGILQFGGDASTGLGFCNVSITDKKV